MSTTNNAVWTTEQQNRLLAQLREIDQGVRSLDATAEACPIPHFVFSCNPYNTSTSFFVPAGSAGDTVGAALVMLSAAMAQIMRNTEELAEAIGMKKEVVLDTLLRRATEIANQRGALIEQLNIEKPPTSFEEARELVIANTMGRPEANIVARQIEETPFFIELHVDDSGQRKAMVLERGQPAKEIPRRALPKMMGVDTRGVGFDFGTLSANVSTAILAYSITYEVLERWSHSQEGPLWLLSDKAVEEHAQKYWPAVLSDFLSLIPPAGSVTPGASVQNVIMRAHPSEK